MYSERNGVKEIDLKEAEEFVSDLVVDAGGILRGYFETRDFSSQEKSGVDFTTSADVKVDKMLREGISKKYPDHQF